MIDKRIFLDFETRCDLSIEDVGSYRYVQHESFEVVLVGFKFGRGRTYVYERPEDLVDEDFTLDGDQLAHYIYAHGAYFDWLVFCRVYKKYNWPEEFTNLGMWIDTMGLAARYTLPLKLYDASRALALPVVKQAGGLALIKKICCPPFKYTPQDMTRFISYCADDVESMYELVKALPHDELSDFEQRLWVLTQNMNVRGFPIDIVSVEAIVKTTDFFLEDQQANLPNMTGGVITKVTQFARMKKFAHDRGVMIPNTQHDTLGEWIEKDIPQEVKDVLTLRYEFGSTAISKFKKLRDYYHEGAVHGTFCYYGAQKTGRWSGRGFQPHNMPRASVDNPERFIEMFRKFEHQDNPIDIAKRLIRSMISPPEGQVLLVSDYKGIENRYLAFSAQDEKTLQLFRDGQDQYKDMAAFLYSIPYEDIDPDQRYMGKTIILGCGYQMGAAKFRETAAKDGLVLTMSEAKWAVDGYRQRYRLVVKLWYGLTNKAMLAVKHEGVPFEYKGIRFKTIKDRTGRRWLSMQLHSGRPLLYCQPHIQDGKYGEEITHMGVNPYSKKWQRLSLSPGRFTENLCQAGSRDIMANGLVAVDDDMPEATVIGTIHDEAISTIHECDITDDTIDIYNGHLCVLPEWGKELPLEAEGYISKRYKKG